MYWKITVLLYKNAVNSMQKSRYRPTTDSVLQDSILAEMLFNLVIEYQDGGFESILKMFHVVQSCKKWLIY